MSEPSFTHRDPDVMVVLWELRSGTVPEVRERLADLLAEEPRRGGAVK